MTALEFNYELEQAYASIYSYTYKFTNNAEEASDLVHDTIVKAIGNRQKFKHGTNLKAWLYTIMRNTFINGYRRGSKLQSIVNNQPDFHNLYLDNGVNTTPYQYTTTKELTQQVDNLTDKLRIPFKLYVEGFKYQEIAEDLNVPIGTIKTRIHHARKMLAQQISR